jgi:hypothetical protein
MSKKRKPKRDSRRAPSPYPQKAPQGAPARRAGPAIAALAIFVIVAAVWAWRSAHGSNASNSAAAVSPSASPAMPAASGQAQPGAAASFPGTFYPSQGHTHLNPGQPDDFVYNSNPPTSGPHKEIFTDQFVNPNPLPAYVQVHLLEHGNVLLQYSCTCPEVASALSSIAYAYDSKSIAPNELQPSPAEVQNAEEQGKAVVVAPYPHMKPRIALTAWTRLAALGTVDKAKIDAFVSAYLSNAANAGQ